MKAQVTIEFIMIIAVIMLVMASVTVMTSNNIRHLDRMSISMEAEKMLDTTASKINTAFLEGSGFSMTMEMPHKVVNRDYTVMVSGNYLLLTIEETSFEKPLLTNNVTQGYIQPGFNAVQNKNGGVVITQI